ncbi:MAG: threonine-phosphate decarboxylase CobD [Pseudomonadota bacterium]
MRDHGGDIDRAARAWGGTDWIDLSTGINRRPYPVPDLSPAHWHALPTASALDALVDGARKAYGLPEAAACLPLAGAQAAIQLIPRLRPPGRVGIVSPTYNEHAAAFAREGWQVRDIDAPQPGFDALVVVNPNNPDGRCHDPEPLAALAGDCLVVIDESFGDVAPGLSAARCLGRASLLVLRSFGKFYGLAGVRLGFACGAAADIGALAEAAGPWAVSGPALEIGRAALADMAWADATRARLRAEAPRLDQAAGTAGWRVVGGTDLFRLYETPDAAAAQDALDRGGIWSRAFPWSARWLRLGLPGSEAEWVQTEAALRAIRDT